MWKGCGKAAGMADSERAAKGSDLQAEVGVPVALAPEVAAGVEDRAWLHAAKAAPHIRGWALARLSFCRRSLSIPIEHTC